MYIGESFVGTGADAAHVNILAGPREGPVGTAFATALASPKPGHIPFVTVLQPNVPVLPATLFVNKADIRGDDHGRLTWGPAQAGVAAGVHAALSQRILPKDAAHDWVLIAAVWVDWQAQDADAVYRNNREASLEAVTRALRNQPRFEEVARAARAPENPFYRVENGAD